MGYFHIIQEVAINYRLEEVANTQSLNMAGSFHQANRSHRHSYYHVTECLGQCKHSYSSMGSITIAANAISVAFLSVPRDALHEPNGFNKLIPLLHILQRLEVVADSSCMDHEVD